MGGCGQGGSVTPFCFVTLDSRKTDPARDQSSLLPRKHVTFKQLLLGFAKRTLIRSTNVNTQNQRGLAGEVPTPAVPSQCTAGGEINRRVQPPGCGRKLARSFVGAVGLGGGCPDHLFGSPLSCMGLMWLL